MSVNTEAPGVSCDQQIVGADNIPSPEQICFDIRRMDRGGLIEVKQDNARQERLQFVSMPYRSVGSQHTHMQFMENDRRDRELAGYRFEALATPGRFVANDTNAEVRIEHGLKDQSSHAPHTRLAEPGQGNRDKAGD